MTTAVTPQLAPGHVGLNVTDLGRSVDFYRRALGFEQLGISNEGERRFAFLGFDGNLRADPVAAERRRVLHPAHPACTICRSRSTTSSRSGRWSRRSRSWA